MPANTGSRAAPMVLIMCTLLIIASVWGDGIRAFVQALPWNVAVALMATLAVAFGITVAATLFWRPR